MDEAGVDALIYSTCLNRPAHIDRGREEYRGDNSQLVAPAKGGTIGAHRRGFWSSPGKRREGRDHRGHLAELRLPRYLTIL
ncbi:MAG: hypothetical protein ABIF09_08685 [Gemmatimonadota bacterium]